MKIILRFILLVTVLLTGLSVAAPQTSASDPATTVPAEQNYWLTIKSGIRHNSKCRYFHNSHGRPCSKDEGRACKLCGG